MSKINISNYQERLNYSLNARDNIKNYTKSQFEISMLGKLCQVL